MRLKARSPSSAIVWWSWWTSWTRGLEHAVGLPVVPDLDQQLEDLLPVVGKRAHVEVVDGEVLGGDADLGRRLAHLRASVSGAKPSGSERVAIENAT